MKFLIGMCLFQLAGKFYGSYYLINKIQRTGKNIKLVACSNGVGIGQFFNNWMRLRINSAAPAQEHLFGSCQSIARLKPVLTSRGWQ
jgi:hypothetical protein